MSGKKLLRLGAALSMALAVAGIGASSATSDTSTPTNPKHFFWAGQTPSADSLTNNIIYHGGNAGPDAIGVEIKPSVYLIYWGAEWATGFTTYDSDGTPYSSKTLQTYLNSFFTNVGGSPWAAVQTQYCRNVPAVVTLGLAENLVDDPIAMEAQRASAHFSYDPDATYIVLTPPRTIGTGQPVYCGYHTQTTSINGLGNPYRLQYSFIPFLNMDWPLLGTEGCGMHNVNATSNAFGNGIFDGYSIVTGHEYSEAVTDPDNFFAIQDGWNDDTTSENADKCAWYHDQNITLGGHHFAVQPTWSNEAYDAGKDGCAVSR